MVEGEKLAQRIDEVLGRQRRYRSLRGALQPFGIRGGTERGDRAIRLPVGLEALEDLLPVVQDHRRRVQCDRSVRLDLRIVPAALAVVVHHHHVVGEVLAESGRLVDPATRDAGTACGCSVRVNSKVMDQGYRSAASGLSPARGCSDVRFDEGRQDHFAGQRAPADVDDDGVALRHTRRGVEQRQGDTDLCGGREGARCRPDLLATLRTQYAQPSRGMPRPVARRPYRRRTGPVGLLCDQRVAAEECGLVPPDGPSGARAWLG